MAELVDQDQDSKFTKLFKQYMKKDPGRSKILENFKSSITFDEALASYDKSDFAHIGSGSYADVFRQQRDSGLIFKLIRLLPEYLHDRVQGASISRSTKYMDAHSEYQISVALSKLNFGIIMKDGLYSCQMFPLVHQGHLTKGKQLPSYFKLNPEEKSTTKNEDMYADYFLSIQRESMLIVMEDCGQPMREIIDTLHPFALLSIVKQILAGFAVAEAVLEFEHRDLHSGNVLLQPCEQEFINYQMRRCAFRVPSFGYRVKIIDTTFSRIRIKQTVHFTDLSHLFGNFNDNAGDLKMQDLCYEQMSQLIDHNWQNYYPKTNLIWIKYVIHKLLRAKPLHSPAEDVVNESAKVKEILNLYNRLMDKCANSSSCFNSILRDPVLNDCVKIIVN